MGAQILQMKPLLLALALLFCCVSMLNAQKKPLDHSVYDSWQSVGEKLISNDGNFIIYTVNVQEGDGVLVIQRSNGDKLLEVPRGYAAKISEDSRYAAFKIKPLYQQTRDARIKKKKPDDMPKDSFALVDLGSVRMDKFARVKNFSFPSKSAQWVAWHGEKAVEDTSKRRVYPPKKDDADVSDAEGDDPAGGAVTEGTLLSLRNLRTQQTVTYPNITEYLFDKNGRQLLLESSGSKKDSSKPAIVVLHLDNNRKDTILHHYNDAKGYAWDEEGNQLAFVAERDSSAKALQKFYKLYYYKNGNDSVRFLADRYTAGMPSGWSVSEFSNNRFSKSGKRLFLGTAPILPPKDTTLPDFERVSVDIWHYNDEDLMPAQLKNLDQELKRNYTAIYDWNNSRVIPISNKNLRQVVLTEEGDGNYFYSGSDSGRRVARQWQGYSVSDIFVINANTGSRKAIKTNFKGNIFPSYSGKYLLLYDDKQRNYQVYNAATGAIKPLAPSLTVPLYDEENDVPDDPNPHGIAKWMQNDDAVLIYDHYDIWKIDPAGNQAPVNLTQNGRKNKWEYRLVDVDDEEKFLKPNQSVILRVYDEKDKSTGIATLALDGKSAPVVLFREPITVNAIAKAKNAANLIYTKESFSKSPDLYSGNLSSANAIKLSAINPQQSDYLWGTAELYKWKAYTGKLTEGVLYKPENFDPHHKYPMIVYFYERNNNTLNNYIAPAPTPSRLNISFFVSRGYVVFVPDIWYTTGHPGKNSYDYIVSGTRALVKEGFIDSTKIGIQGQSWGGYQTAYVITQTPLYAAAWAGAPVANMFSAYGGIRWESGLNRQMQYEHSQSRIGATIWEKPELYIENSPLFHLQKVKTPLVIMSNDADGAVPWYQGIEMFTAMRRLNKKVWLLDYNNEAHNLVERRNRKDIQIREQQYFDWLLKGEQAPHWITGGVPATMKGRDWGFNVD
ncbi:MAG: acylaminoacyl-peptidase [Chitinophagaceae bacterium]|nr:acylaminoacyl-peptidase [Chitinophagaceae bacterium]